jgi:hypothetical protein
MMSGLMETVSALKTKPQPQMTRPVPIKCRLDFHQFDGRMYHIEGKYVIICSRCFYIEIYDDTWGRGFPPKKGELSTQAIKELISKARERQLQNGVVNSE